MQCGFPPGDVKMANGSLEHANWEKLTQEKAAEASRVSTKTIERRWRTFLNEIGVDDLILSNLNPAAPPEEFEHYSLGGQNE